MIVSYDALYGYISTIIFHLAERVATTDKSIKSVLGYCVDMLGFSYNAIPTRHEIHVEPYLQEDSI